MARYRTYKPELFADEKLTECSVDARFLFLGLLPFLDDMGRRQYHPRRIKAEVFPADDEYTVEVVEGLVQELQRVGVIELYELGKNRYLRVPHFLRHQYVKKPTHSYVPPSPSEGPDAIRCNCLQCKAKANRNGQDDVFPQELPHQYRTSTTPVANQFRTSGDLVSDKVGQEGKKEGNSKGIGKGENQHQHTGNSNLQSNPPISESETNSENRRAMKRDLDEIAIRVLRLLHLPDNPLLISALSQSIQVKTRSRNCSVEWAGQQILAKAALVAAESPPEDWVQWFEDARYEYFPPGDKRLENKRIEARPTCGGSRCSDGWEMVKIGEVIVVSRRCPDCERAWRDQGV